MKNSVLKWYECNKENEKYFNKNKNFVLKNKLIKLVDFKDNSCIYVTVSTLTPIAKFLQENKIWNNFFWIFKNNSEFLKKYWKIHLSPDYVPFNWKSYVLEDLKWEISVLSNSVELNENTKFKKFKKIVLSQLMLYITLWSDIYYSNKWDLLKTVNFIKKNKNSWIITYYFIWNNWKLNTYFKVLDYSNIKQLNNRFNEIDNKINLLYNEKIKNINLENYYWNLYEKYKKINTPKDLERIRL